MCQEAVSQWKCGAFDQNVLTCGDVTVMTDYACKKTEDAKKSLEALLATEGKKIAVVEPAYEEIAKEMGIACVITAQRPSEVRAERFLAERELEKKILAELEPGATLLLCGNRYMDFNVTLRRVFGVTDGVITDVW